MEKRSTKFERPRRRYKTTHSHVSTTYHTGCMDTKFWQEFQISRISSFPRDKTKTSPWVVKVGHSPFSFRNRPSWRNPFQPRLHLWPQIVPQTRVSCRRERSPRSSYRETLLSGVMSHFTYSSFEFGTHQSPSSVMAYILRTFTLKDDVLHPTRGDLQLVCTQQDSIYFDSSIPNSVKSVYILRWNLIPIPDYLSETLVQRPLLLFTQRSETQEWMDPW